MSKKGGDSTFLPFLRYNEKHEGADTTFFVAIVGAICLFVIFSFSFLLLPSPNIRLPDMFNRTHPENAAVIRTGRSDPGSCTPGFHLDVPFGTNQPECVVNIPIPSAVDETLLASNSRNVCNSFATYVCNKFVGTPDVIDFTFGAAAKSANRMYDTVSRLTSAESKSQEVRSLYNFVLSCVYSSIRPNVTNELVFAHDTLQRVEPHPSLNMSSDGIAGFAVGASIALGNQAALGARTTLNFASNGEALIRWDIGMQMKMVALLDSETLEYVVESSCGVLSATGHFPYEMWLDTNACKNDISTLYHSMAMEMARLVLPETNVAYLMSPQYQSDLLTAEQLGDYAGSRDFVNGILFGLETILDFDRPMLAEYGIHVPGLHSLRQWALAKDAVKIAAARARNVGTARWLAYIKAMMAVNNFQYSDALMNLDGLNTHIRSGPIEFKKTTVPATHGMRKDPHKHLHRVEINGHASIPRIDKKNHKKETKKSSYARDSWVDDSALVNSVMYDQCVFLASQYFPDVDTTFSSVAVSSARSNVMNEVSGKIRESIVQQIASSKALDAESKEILVNRIRAIAVHEGSEYSGVRQPDMPVDIKANDGFLKNSVELRRRNAAQQAMQVFACHGKKPADCLPTSHYIGRSGPEINAFFNPAAATLTVLPGMMHPIFFSEEMSPISQLARGGVVLGHEFWHSVDDVGKMYDERGNVGQEWQTPAIKEWLENQEKCFKKQINSYTTPLGNRLKSDNILGEVIADVRGATSALRATDKKLTGAELREFVETLGQTWCSSITSEEEEYRIKHGDHPPPAARIDLMMKNLVLPNGQHVMAAAYGCKKGSPMYPNKVCEVV